jgi:hypothetical protein
MSARRQDFVVFMSPGSFYDETTSMPIETRDTAKMVELSKGIVERYGATPYGFRFETRIVAEPVPDGEGGTLTVPSKTVESSGNYYLGGELKTYYEVRDEKPDSILASNMQSNDGMEIVWTRPGFGARVFGPQDFVVSDETGEILKRGDSQFHLATRQTIRAALNRRHVR